MTSDTASEISKKQKLTQHLDKSNQNWFHERKLLEVGEKICFLGGFLCNLGETTPQTMTVFNFKLTVQSKCICCTKTLLNYD